MTRNMTSERRGSWWNSLLLIGGALAALIGIVSFLPRVRPLPAAIQQNPLVLVGGSLRSMTWVIDVPSDGDERDRITVSRDQVVSRMRGAAQVRQERISDGVWHALETLRMAWCTEPPVGIQPGNAPDVYRIAVDCDLTRSPIYHIAQDDLPPAIQQLMTLVIS